MSKVYYRMVKMMKCKKRFSAYDGHNRKGAILRTGNDLNEMFSDLAFYNDSNDGWDKYDAHCDCKAEIQEKIRK